MKKISATICILLLVAIALASSGCCVVAGYGMKNAQEQRKDRADAFHKKINEAMEKAQ